MKMLQTRDKKYSKRTLAVKWNRIPGGVNDHVNQKITAKERKAKNEVQSAKSKNSKGQSAKIKVQRAKGKKSKGKV